MEKVLIHFHTGKQIISSRIDLVVDSTVICYTSKIPRNGESPMEIVYDNLNLNTESVELYSLLSVSFVG